MDILRLYIPRQTEAQRNALDLITQNILISGEGYTLTNGIGVWAGVEERVAILELWTEKANYNIWDAMDYLRDAGESAIGYVLNGVPHISNLQEG